MRPLSFLSGLTLGTLIMGSIVSAWTGPTQTAPGGNVSAPINVGSIDQVKSAGLGVNSLAVYGNTILNGTNVYLNFGTTAGSGGYGIRDNAGTLEFKSTGGSWNTLTTAITNVLGIGAVTLIKFADGTTQTSAGGTLPVFTSRYGSGRRCAGDAWVAACGYNPGLPWNYNVCYSRGHAVTYGWNIIWVPAVNGYQQAPAASTYQFDVICDI